MKLTRMAPIIDLTVSNSIGLGNTEENTAGRIESISSSSLEHLSPNAASRNCDVSNIYPCFVIIIYCQIKIRIWIVEKDLAE